MTIYKGSCHCQAVLFEVKCSVDIAYVCDCSMCARKSARMVYASEEDLTIVQGREALSTYRFNTHAAEHYFCQRCGIYTFHRTRTLAGKFGINAGCLEGVIPHELELEIIHGSER